METAGRCIRIASDYLPNMDAHLKAYLRVDMAGGNAVQYVTVGWLTREELRSPTKKYQLYKYFNQFFNYISVTLKLPNASNQLLIE